MSCKFMYSQGVSRKVTFFTDSDGGEGAGASESYCSLTSNPCKHTWFSSSCPEYKASNSDRTKCPDCGESGKDAPMTGWTRICPTCRRRVMG